MKKTIKYDKAKNNKDEYDDVNYDDDVLSEYSDIDDVDDIDDLEGY